VLRCLAPAALACFALAACEGKDPPPSPSTGGSSDDVQVSGGERLGWSQQANNESELGSFQYALYLDNNRSVLAGVSCESTSASDSFDCSAPLPVLTLGPHTIELAAFTFDGSLYESARSAPLRLVMTALTLASGAQVNPVVVTVEQLRLSLQLVADGLDLPSDIAFASDGSVMVAERGGTVRVIRDGELLPAATLDMPGDVSVPAGGLLAIALDPNFAESGIVYTLFATGSSGRGQIFTLARYRVVGDRFGERAILLDRIPASPRGASGALRVGPDGKLYVALDDGSNGRTADRLGSFNGKVLRLNVDATTPDDQAGLTPIYSLDHPLPRAMDWQPSSGRMWVIDAVEPNSGRLTAVAAGNVMQRPGFARVRYALPEGTGASSAAFYRDGRIPVFRGNLFIGAETGRHLIRIRFDPQNPERIVSVEKLLENQIGPVRVVAAGPDGALYICNETALFRLAP
jgi:glucose/arabinose dehydrogenase